MTLVSATALALIGIFTGCSNDESLAGKMAPAEERKAASPDASADKDNQGSVAAGNYQTIEWTDLIPEDDLEALLSPPDYLEEIEDGSEADQIDSQTQNPVAAKSDDRYQQALASRRIIAEYHNRDVRLPGFIVPLEFDDEMTVTEFFLVPYFGACIHLPPPPPNQVIHVTFESGLQVDELADPFWISGTIKTHIVENDVATAAYTMQAATVEPYDDYVDMPEG